MASLLDLTKNVFKQGQQKVNPFIQYLDRDKSQAGFQFTSPATRGVIKQNLGDVKNTLDRNKIKPGFQFTSPQTQQNLKDFRYGLSGQSQGKLGMLKPTKYGDTDLGFFGNVAKGAGITYRTIDPLGKQNIPKYEPATFGEKVGSSGMNLIKSVVEGQNIGVNQTVDTGVRSITQDPTFQFFTSKVKDYGANQLTSFIQKIKPLKITFKDLRDVTTGRGTPEQLIKYNRLNALKERGFTVQEILKTGEGNQNPLMDIADFLSQKMSGIIKKTPQQDTKLLSSGADELSNIIKPVVQPKPTMTNAFTGNQILVPPEGQAGFFNPFTMFKKPVEEVVKKAKSRLPESAVSIKWTENGQEQFQIMGKGDAMAWTARLQDQGIEYKLTNLGNQSGFARLGNASTDLATEAKKYGSAEEFVKAQGTPVFHGSNRVSQETLRKEGFKIPEFSRDDGLHFSTSKEYASKYGGLNETYFSGKVKPKVLKSPDDLPYGEDLLKEGYDAVRYMEDGIENLYVASPSKLKTKSQLTDIYNQAKQEPTIKLFGRKLPAGEKGFIRLGGEPKSVPEQGQLKVKGQSLSSEGIIADAKIKGPEVGKVRGLVTSVQEAPNITNKTQGKVTGSYIPKPNEDLMGEAKALLEEGASITIKGVKGIDKKIAATMQEAINLDKAGNHQAAANLLNNLSEQGTELGRAVQAFSLLPKMSPESIALSAAGRIKKYNASLKPGAKPIPELSGDQVQIISEQVKKIDSLTGREKNLAINELQNTLNSYIPSSLVDKVITVWKAGLLTSLRTHERNLLGNTIMSLSETAKDLPATLADKLLSLRTGQRTTTFTIKGAKTGAIQGIKTGKDIITKGFDPEDAIGKYEVQRVNWGTSKTGKFLKTYTDAVFRTLGGADKPFWKSSFARSLYDQAGAKAINAGKQGDAKFITSLVDKPTEEMLLQATKDANAATFQDKNVVSTIASAVKRAAGKNDWTKLLAEMVMPFTGVPSSVVAKTIDYSPIGLIRGIMSVGNVAIKNIPELQREASQQLGRGVIGTAIFALGAYLMQKGLMTGQAKDQKERDLWKAQGKQENSIFVNGKWRGINSIGPQNLILLAGAKYNENTNDPEKGVGSYLGEMGQDQLNQTFLQGVQGPLQAVNDPDRYGASYIGRTGASVVPNIVKDVSKAFDSKERETNTITDYLQQGIPGLRNDLLPKRNVLGEEIKQEPSGVGAFIDLFNSKTPIDTDITRELERLNDAGTPATPSKISKTFTSNGKKIVLTPEQLNQYEKGTGDALRPALTKLFKSPEYQAMTNDKKKKTIDNLVSDIRAEYKKENKDLLTGKTEYTTTDSSPKTSSERLKQTLISFAPNPITTTKLLIKGEPIKETIFSGDNFFEKITKFSDAITVTERAEGTSDLDEGDRTTQVDHIIPKWLGGREEDGNYQALSVEEHKQMTALDNKLLKQFKAGDVSQAEARKQIEALNKTLNGTPITAKEYKALSEIVSTSTDSTKIGDLSVSTREKDKFPFPDYSKSTSGQVLRADLNFEGKGDADIVFHLKTPDGKVINVPQTKEKFTGGKDYYGLELQIPQNTKTGTGEVWATVNGKEIAGTRKSHEIVSASSIDRYSDDNRKNLADNPTFKRENIIDSEVSAGIETYKSGSGATVEERANWVQTQLEGFGGTKEERQAFINDLYDEKVLTTGSRGTIAKLKELGIDVSRYTGTTKGKTSGSKKGAKITAKKVTVKPIKLKGFKAPSVKIPSAPKIKGYKPKTIALKTPQPKKFKFSVSKPKVVSGRSGTRIKAKR